VSPFGRFGSTSVISNGRTGGDLGAIGPKAPSGRGSLRIPQLCAPRCTVATIGAQKPGDDRATGDSAPLHEPTTVTIERFGR